MHNSIFKAALITLTIFAVSACTKDLNSKDPATFYTNMVKNKLNLTPEEYLNYFSMQSLKDGNLSESAFIGNVKKTLDDLKFAGYKLEDVKINSVDKYDNDTVIIRSSLKYKTSDKSEDQFTDDLVVLLLENGTWKISLSNLIKHYHYTNSCGAAGSISLCIADSYIYPDKTMFSGKLNNATNDTYTFGFASPASILTVLADNSKVYGDYPSTHNGQTPTTIQPGNNNITFYFGTALDPQLIKSPPVYFAINQLKKVKWGGMPALGDKGQQIDIDLHSK